MDQFLPSSRKKGGVFWGEGEGYLNPKGGIGVFAQISILVTPSEGEKRRGGKGELVYSLREEGQFLGGMARKPLSGERDFFLGKTLY